MGNIPHLVFAGGAKLYGGALLALYAIGDLHLSIGGDKPMDVFGGRWINYVEKLREGFASLGPEDVTVLCGDLSWGMSLEGAKEIRVFNKLDAFWDRALANLKTIGEAAPACKISLSDLDDTEALRESIAGSDILTNATRVGMKPMDGESLITDTTMFRPELIVTDVVYDPEETKLLRDAKAAGCRTFDGLGMLVEQGAASFKLYTGLDMPVGEVCDAIYR